MHSLAGEAAWLPQSAVPPGQDGAPFSEMRLCCRLPVDLAKGTMQTSTQATWLTASCLLRGNQRRLHGRGAPIRREGEGAVWAPCSGPAHLTCYTFPASLVQLAFCELFHGAGEKGLPDGQPGAGSTCRHLAGVGVRASPQHETPENALGRCVEW